MNSVANFVARKLCKSLNRLNPASSNISGFEPGKHTRNRITICATLQLTRSTLLIEIKLYRENLYRNNTSIPCWVDTQTRHFVQYSYEKHCKSIVQKTLDSMLDTPAKTAPLDKLIGGKLITMCRYNIPDCGLYQLSTTRDNLLFSTKIKGMNGDGDSTVRIPVDDMLSVYTVNPKRPELDRLLQREVKKIFKQEGV